MEMKYPDIGRVFELSSKNGVNPLKVVEVTLGSSTGWTHDGQVVGRWSKRRFKLVPLGVKRNLEEAKGSLKEKYGELPEGQWALFFKETFPGENEPVAVADDSWIDPDGERRFAVINRQGQLYFDEAGRVIPSSWLWLVSVNGDE